MASSASPTSTSSDSFYESLVPKRWWVVFRDADIAVFPWWRWFTMHRPGFGHCFAFADVPGSELNLIVNPQMGRVEYLVLEGPPSDLVQYWRAPGNTLVTISRPPLSDRYVSRSIGLTCASVLAYTIGVPFGGLTPWQLYRRLLKMGAEEILGERRQEDLRRGQEAKGS